MPLIARAKSTEAQIQLGHIHSLEKSYYYMYSRYSMNMDEIGFEQETLNLIGLLVEHFLRQIAQNMTMAAAQFGNKF